MWRVRRGFFLLLFVVLICLGWLLRGNVRLVGRICFVLRIILRVFMYVWCCDSFFISCGWVRLMFVYMLGFRRWLGWYLMRWMVWWKKICCWFSSFWIVVWYCGLICRMWFLRFLVGFFWLLLRMYGRLVCWMLG